MEGAGPHSGKGAGLEKALQSKGVRGILNGVEDIVRPSNRELGKSEQLLFSPPHPPRGPTALPASSRRPTLVARAVRPPPSVHEHVGTGV